MSLFEKKRFQLQPHVKLGGGFVFLVFSEYFDKKFLMITGRLACFFLLFFSPSFNAMDSRTFSVKTSKIPHNILNLSLN
jgi:hypothetical protein